MKLHQRKVIAVVPGWPQAVWRLRCGHAIVLNTSFSGIVNPQPRGPVLCRKCQCLSV